MKKLIAPIVILFILFFSHSTTFAALSYQDLQDVTYALKQAFVEINQEQNHTLQVNKPIPGISPTYWWDIDMVHASYVREEKPQGIVEHNLYLMGGFVRLPLMTREGLLLTGCHEMGHGLGGEPKKLSSDGSVPSSTEGQSDYFATRVCLPIALKYLPVKDAFQIKPIYQKICSLQKEHEQNICLRMMYAIDTDVAYFQYLGAKPSLETYSKHQQSQLDLNPSYYPGAQCRIDTEIHGLLGLERPECWYPNGEKNGKLRENL